MIFSHLCRITAVLLIVTGIVLLGFGIRDSLNGPEFRLTSDLTIRTAAEMILASIVLGTLAEISFSLRKKSND